MNDNNAIAIEAIIEAMILEEGRMAPKKRLLVESAILCFMENGYDATSTRMIADRADAAEATIFRHFGTKKALLMRITEPVVKRVLAPAAKGQALELGSHAGGLRAFLRAIMLSRLAFADRYAPLVKIILQEYMVIEELRDMLNTHIGGLMATVSSDIFEQFRASGQVKDVAPGRMLRWSLSLLAGYYLQRSILSPGKWDDEAEVDAMLDMMLDGVGLQ